MKLYLAIGWGILIAAVFLNMVASFFKICTWYDYLRSITSLGFYKATIGLSWFDVFFLFFFYPGILGFIASYAKSLLS